MTRLDDIEARLWKADLLQPEGVLLTDPQDKATDADLRDLLTIARAAEIPYRRVVLKSGKVDIVHQYPQSTAHREGWPCDTCAALATTGKDVK